MYNQYFKCVIYDLQDSRVEFGTSKCGKLFDLASQGRKLLKKEWCAFRFFFSENNAIVTRLMDRLTQQLAPAIDVASKCMMYAVGGGGVVSPLSSPIPGDKRVRATAQTDGGSRGIHILKAAGTRLQQGVPLTLFIHLRSSGAGAAVAGAGAHGACHQVPM